MLHRNVVYVGFSNICKVSNVFKEFYYAVLIKAKRLHNYSETVSVAIIVKTEKL